MAQDPERKDEERDQDELLTSHALDMVALWDSSNIGFGGGSGHDPRRTGFERDTLAAGGWPGVSPTSAFR